uniref:Uncharacterized protein n=1 Tax=Panagrolaimus sp. ES5 TaxID=591445 RepID=A0AC34G468_9BILA
MDAEKVMELWPSWWKGYYRLARVYIFQEEWSEAEKTLDTAVFLNSESKLIRDELSYVRYKASLISDNFVTDPFPESTEMVKKELCKVYDLSEEELKDPEKLAQSLPEIFVNFIKGHQFQHGIYVPEDSKKAVEFYKNSANLGNAEAMFEIGKLYLEGKGLKHDFDEAIKWFLQAANSPTTQNIDGIPDAQHILGVLYFHGIGVNKNYRKAAEWYKKAVQNGSEESANNLGDLYLQGLGGEQSYMKALCYFKFGAENGSTGAMINLANCYFMAEGTESNEITQEYFDEGQLFDI